MKFVSFPKIGQFRNAVKGLKQQASYSGKDEDGNPIYNPYVELPTITFTGTIKLHGTNAGIGFLGDEVWYQSRSNILTPLKDNAGFAAAFSATEKVEKLKEINKTLRTENNVDPNHILVIFGEWAGSGIQKGVAISELSKRFVVFGVRVVSQECKDTGDYVYDVWLPCEGVKDHDIDIYNVNDYESYKVDVDLQNPDLSRNKLVEITENVEKMCPFGKAFGIEGTGEGVVYVGEYNGKVVRFKVKGEKHSASKVKKLANVDPERIKNIEEFVEYSVTENRLNQAIEQVFTSTSLEPDIKETGKFLKWVVGDIAKEEIDTLSENGLCVKDVSTAISNKARKWYFEYLDTLV